MDARMPEMDGYEATARIREINKNVVIIFQSAYTEKVNQELALHAGCNAFLNKPVDSNELLYLMKKLIPS
jgi:CheY-like chemotaxis protein